MEGTNEDSSSGPEDIVRTIFDRWNARERDLDPKLIDPEIELHSHMTGDVYRGFDGVTRWAAEIDQQFEQWISTIEEVRPIHDDSLLLTGRLHGRGLSSGIDLDQPAAWIVDFRGGRMAKIQTFVGREAADRAIAIAAAR